MKYLGNYVTSNLTNNKHLTNRIRLAITAMIKLNEAGYNESLDALNLSDQKQYLVKIL